MEKKKYSNDNYSNDNMEEVHSYKVRRLLGEMPRSLSVWGAVVIVAVAMGLLGAVCLIPYPYSGGESILTHLLNQK